MPVKKIPAEKLKHLLYGTQGEEITVQVEGRNGRQTSYNATFEGIIPNLERRYRESNSEYIRNKITEFMSDRPCPTCKGTRLRPEALAVTVDDRNVVEVTDWPVLDTLHGLNGWPARDAASPARWRLLSVS
jgi:excinuclease ABC subunit A